ncbi:MAG: transglutaminase-like cysteine peptidase [Sphingomicrobium sp.]
MANPVSNLLRGLLAGAALSLAATAANAEVASAPGYSARWLKSEAILGQPSALEAMIAAQQGQAVAARAPRPMSYSRPMEARLPLFQRRGEEGVTSGRPDVFGTIALPVSRTPLDARWNRAGTVSVGGAAARYAATLANHARLEQLEAVNRYVNARVRFVDDSVQFGQSDVWSSASATLNRGTGDCEDYAIAKMQMLRRAGFSDRDLYLVVVRDLVRRSDHAVLTVRSDGHMYVLDNGTDALLESNEVADYRPIMTFAANGAWTHGYRKSATSVEYAANDVTRAVAPATGN